MPEYPDTRKVYEIIQQEIFTDDKGNIIAWIVLSLEDFSGEGGQYKVSLLAPLGFNLASEPIKIEEWGKSTYAELVGILRSFMSKNTMSYMNWSDIPQVLDNYDPIEEPEDTEEDE